MSKLLKIIKLRFVNDQYKIILLVEFSTIIEKFEAYKKLNKTINNINCSQGFCELA